MAEGFDEWLDNLPAAERRCLRRAFKREEGLKEIMSKAWDHGYDTGYNEGYSEGEDDTWAQVDADTSYNDED